MELVFIVTVSSTVLFLFGDSLVPTQLSCSAVLFLGAACLDFSHAYLNSDKKSNSGLWPLDVSLFLAALLSEEFQLTWSHTSGMGFPSSCDYLLIFIPIPTHPPGPGFFLGLMAFDSLGSDDLLSHCTMVFGCVITFSTSKHL